ncbi:MAG: hypothetical protein IJO81_04335 [Clostridia bacterium]|nr:hypothetical protein [Clostridia bacterium]
MANIIHTTFWNYNAFADYKSQMLRDWIELGITTPTLPVFTLGHDKNEDLIAILDDARSLGIQVILQFDKMFLENYYNGADVYRADVMTIVDTFGRHPAVYGYYVGEEPNTDSEEAYFEGMKIIRECHPECHVYTNFGSIERTERMLLKGEQNINDWVKKFKDYSGADIIGFGVYSQLFRDKSGVFEAMYNIRTFVEAGKKAGVDVWVTPLSSAHDFYRAPTVDDFRWQINVPVACGCKGAVWFRLYDKIVAFDYRESPIDEFGIKTGHFYDLARVQKKFNILYGGLFNRLSHIESYGLGVSFGGYPYFTPGASDLIEHADCRSGMLSFFKDEDGNDYIAVVNTDMENSYHMTLHFSEKVAKAEFVYYNGDKLVDCFTRGDLKGPGKSSPMCLAPGHMEVIKITRA